MTDLDAIAARAAEERETAPAARAVDLSRLFAPSSLAIVGASERPGTIGHTLTETLAGLKFAGPIWPINPRHSELYGLRCYASVADLPGAPDMVVFGIKGSAAVDELEALGALGARAAVIYDNGFAEAGEAGAALQARLVATCRRYGIALCGPNCMGTIGAHDGFSSYRLAITEPERFRGGVGLISHSGSITIGLLADVRRYGFSKVVSAGNEAVADAADYIQHFIDDPHTRIIACFLDTVRRPAAFRAALERAAALDKPVVVLKVGRSARAGHAIVTHTGGLAGEAQVFSDVLRRLNAIEVADLVEMSEVLAALDGSRRPRGRRIAVATGSGGQAELLLDVADAADLSFPPLDRESIAEWSGWWVRSPATAIRSIAGQRRRAHEPRAFARASRPTSRLRCGGAVQRAVGRRAHPHARHDHRGAGRGRAQVRQAVLLSQPARRHDAHAEHRSAARRRRDHARRSAPGTARDRRVADATSSGGSKPFRQRLRRLPPTRWRRSGGA